MFSAGVRERYQQDLRGIEEAGLLKRERFIRSPQGADICVEFPRGRPSSR